MRKVLLKLRYRPRRVECPRCGLRVEDFPWADPWARVTTAVSNAVARLARELSWQGTARQYGWNWKSVATIVKRAVACGLAHRVRPPVHVIGIDEVGGLPRDFLAEADQTRRDPTHSSFVCPREWTSRGDQYPAPSQNRFQAVR